jgi:hypothetical protein
MPRDPVTNITFPLCNLVMGLSSLFKVPQLTGAWLVPKQNSPRPCALDYSLKLSICGSVNTLVCAFSSFAGQRHLSSYLIAVFLHRGTFPQCLLHEYKSSGSYLRDSGKQGPALA